MIFVTVGHATQGFRRLLNAVDALAGNGICQSETIFVQSGHTHDFRSAYCEHQSFLSRDEFEQWMNKADLIICHGGCGTVLHAVRLGKTPVVMPRRKKYGEHVNDHQMQLTQVLASEGRIIPVYEPDELVDAITAARHHYAKSANESASPMLALVAQAIDELIGPRNNGDASCRTNR